MKSNAAKPEHDLGPSHENFEDEDRPLSLEDLPDQCLGIILRKFQNPGDKIRLTQASPGARRLCTGPKAEPGVLGSITLDFEGLGERQTAHLTIDHHLTLRIKPRGRPISPELLEWFASRARSFDRVVLSFPNDPNPEVCEEALSYVASLSAASFKGPLKAYINDLLCASNFHPSTVTSLEALGSLLPSSSLALSAFMIDCNLPEVSEFLKRVSNCSEVDINLVFGSWSPSFFDQCASLESLDLGNCDELHAFALSPALKPRLRRLSLDWLPSWVNLSMNLDSSCTALENVSLAYFDESELPRLRALESLPVLKALYIGVDKTAFDPDPDLEGLKISLPGLDSFSVLVAVCVYRDAPPTTVSYRFPLAAFHCPELRRLNLNVEERYFAEGKQGLPAEGVVESLARFPLLECLTVQYDNVSSQEARSKLEDPALFCIDLSTVDFSRLPWLAYVSIESGVTHLPPPSRMFPLPLLASKPSFNALWQKEYSNASVRSRFKERYGY